MQERIRFESVGCQSADCCYDPTGLDFWFKGFRVLAVVLTGQSRGSLSLIVALQQVVGCFSSLS